jgi:hypothetical protein
MPQTASMNSSTRLIRERMKESTYMKFIQSSLVEAQLT